jgi:hypothetical protein
VTGGVDYNVVMRRYLKYPTYQNRYQRRRAKRRAQHRGGQQTRLGSPARRGALLLRLIVRLLRAGR